MCFSAEASFIGSAALAVIGTATFNMVKQTQNKLWAAIPLLFAVQQFCEGIVWLELNETIAHSALTVLAKELYLFFALALWVMWIPLAFAVAEPSPTRKKVLQVILVFGVLLAIIQLDSFSIFSSRPSVKGRSLEYQTESIPYKTLGFLLAVSLPPLISSLKYMKIFGLLLIISYLAAHYFYQATFVSVWCFFAGFVSLVLYLIARAHAAQRRKMKSA